MERKLSQRLHLHSRHLHCATPEIWMLSLSICLLKIFFIFRHCSHGLAILYQISSAVQKKWRGSMSKLPTLNASFAVKLAQLIVQFGPQHHTLRIESAHIHCYAYLLYSSSSTSSYQFEVLVLLWDDSWKWHFLYYQSRRSRSAVRSALAFEVLVFIDPVDAAYRMAVDMKLTHGTSFDLLLYVYNYRLATVSKCFDQRKMYRKASTYGRHTYRTSVLQSLQSYRH